MTWRDHWHFIERNWRVILGDAVLTTVMATACFGIALLLCIIFTEFSIRIPTP